MLYTIGVILIGVVMFSGMIGGAYLFDIITWRLEASVWAGFLMIFGLSGAMLAASVGIAILCGIPLS
jgi:hypothetical protein